MNDKGVYRTAPVTPGLLMSRKSSMMIRKCGRRRSIFEKEDEEYDEEKDQDQGDEEDEEQNKEPDEEQY